MTDDPHNINSIPPWSSQNQDDWQLFAPQVGLNPTSSETLAVFATLYTQLIETNKTLNLTRITDANDFFYRHLLDSLQLLPFLSPNTQIADVGSGAGFPALPIALTRSDLKVTAIESIGKKCRFIQQASEALGLSERFTVLSDRSEALAQTPQYREQFDAVTARAVSALPVLLELCIPLVKPGGYFLALKGARYPEELAAADTALASLKTRLIEIKSAAQHFKLPQLEGSVLLVFEKTKKTPVLYPRTAALIKKMPL